MGVVALFAACSEDETVASTPTPETPTSLTLEQTALSVPAEGGHFTVAYTLEGAVEGAELKVMLQDDSWIKNLDSSVEGVISFDVKASYEAEPRSCRMELIYPGLYPNPELSITQAKGMEPSFTFQVKRVMSNTILMDVLPKDKEQPYVFLLGKKKYMVEENLLEDDAAQVASDLEMIGDFGAAFGGSLQEVIGAFMYEGDQLSYAWNGVDRNTEYVAYAYGFDVDTLQPTTEVCRVEITTLNVQDYIVDFDLEVEVNGPNVAFNITPQGYDGYYFFGVFAAADCPPGTDETKVRSYCEAAWEEQKALYSPFFESTEEGLHFIFNELAYHGPYRFETDLSANTEYVLWAFAMNDEALMNSSPVLKYFETGDPLASQNQFEVLITDIKARKATITVRPSNKDPYVAAIVTSERFAGMDDAKIMAEICTWDYSIAEGEFTTTVSNLSPATGYEILVFGINGGSPSTGLTRKKFTTEEATPSQALFRLTYDTFYDLEEVAAIDPAWEEFLQYDLLLKMGVETDESVVNVYYHILETPIFHYYTPEYLTQDLLEMGPTDIEELFLLNYEMSFTIYGFAEDRDGNFTEFWSSPETLFHKEDRSPAEELIAPKTTTRSASEEIGTLRQPKLYPLHQASETFRMPHVDNPMLTIR